MADPITFLGALLRSPKGVGAIAPSGRGLAAMMVKMAGIEPGQVIVELGAGTGPMTRAIVDAHPDNPLLVIEPDPELAAACRERVPEAEVIEAYAQDVRTLLRDRGHEGAQRIVSSLPFAIWPDELQRDVLDAVIDVLEPGGCMVTFTYVHGPWLPAGRRVRALLDDRFASVTCSPTVWANLPPAFVYTCERGDT
jgi:phosphatidylethanolamine/phosphatidyl-N-methylethanolamine N-methyltransferase